MGNFFWEGEWGGGLCEMVLYFSRDFVYNRME